MGLLERCLHHNCDQKMLAGLSSPAEISAKDLKILERRFKYTNISLNVTILLLSMNLYYAWILFEKLEIILDFINQEPLHQSLS